MGWIRTRLLFAIQRATNLCIRGSRSRPSKTVLVFVTVNLLQFGECFAPFLKRKLGKVTTGQKKKNVDLKSVD